MASRLLILSLAPALVSGCWLVASFGDLGGDAATADAASDAGGAYRVEVAIDGPVMYLRLGEKSGPTAFDSTNDNHNGSYPDAGVMLGLPGAIKGDPDTAVGFDGLHAIVVPPGFEFSGVAPFSIEVWANQTKYEGFGATVDHEDWANGRRGWDLSLADPSLPLPAAVAVERWSTADGSPIDSTYGSNTHTAASLPIDGAFHHVVATYDGSTLCVYVDGTQAPCKTATVTMLINTGIDWAIGAERHCVSPCQNGFIGTLDEFALYDHALTPARVLRHYQAGIGQ